MPSPPFRFTYAKSAEEARPPPRRRRRLHFLDRDDRPLGRQRLRQRHDEQTVLERRGDLTSVYRHRQSDAAEKRPIGPLHAVVALFFFLLLHLTLQGEQVARERDLDVLRIDAGHLGLHDHGVLRFRDVKFRRPVAGHRLEWLPLGLDEAVEEVLHLAPEIPAPRSQSPHRTLLSRATQRARPAGRRAYGLPEVLSLLFAYLRSGSICNGAEAPHSLGRRCTTPRSSMRIPSRETSAD